MVAGCKNTIIPDSVTSIGESAFYDCTRLTSITIPNSVTSISEWAFSGCTGLTSITIPDSVTSIGERAFSGCRSLTSITIPDSVTSIGGCAFLGCTRLTSVTIPDSVTNIGDWAFSGCTGLTSITIPNSVTSIGESAFHSCDRLITITIPNSVTSIGESAFCHCHNLESIIVGNENTRYDSRNDCNAIIETETESNTIVRGCQNTTIPNDITSIGAHAFCGSFNLFAIDIPKSVTKIEDYAFNGCRTLTCITIPDSVTSIGNEAFYGCTGLTSITISGNVTNIGNDIFKECENLRILRMPKGLKETYCKMGLAPWRDRIYEEITLADNMRYAVNDSTKTAIVIAHDADSDVQYEGSVVVPARIKVNDTEFAVTAIEQKAFAGCEALLSVTLPKGLTDIGENVFDDCENLTIIRVPKGMKETYCQMGLESWREIVQEPQEEEYTILLNIARGYEQGIGMAKNLAQAAICYIQAADKGCAEAAFHLGELYEAGKGLPKDLKQAADWYAKATALYHPVADSRRKACLQQLEDEEKRLEAFQREEWQEREERQKQEEQTPIARTAPAKTTYLFFDTETNGLPANYTADIDKTGNWPRVIQIGWIATDADGNVLKKRTEWIRPDGFTLSSEVSRLTGISSALLNEKGKEIKDVLEEFVADVNNAEYIVGHNVDFDTRVVGCELCRAWREDEGRMLINKPQICTMKQTVDFCAIPSTNFYYRGYKFPKLTELYTKLFGHSFGNAHDAMADITATKECFFELKRKGVL